MTTRKTFKARVRARMEKTGERYSAALRNLEPRDAPPEAPAPAPSPSAASEASLRPERPGAPPLTSDARVRETTGRGFDEWFALLDAAGADGMTHTQIARWLVAEHGIPGWWAQNVTVGYERARGRRAANQTASGFQVGASKTVGVPLERLYRAFADPDERARWAPAEGELRWTTEQKGARLDWPDGSRVIVSFTSKGADRSVIALVQERLADAEAVERQRAVWRAALATLKRQVEEA